MNPLQPISDLFKACQMFGLAFQMARKIAKDQAHKDLTVPHSGLILPSGAQLTEERKYR